MFEKLLQMEEKYDDINNQLSDPDVINDREKYTAFMKEYKNLTPIVEAFRAYKATQAELEEAKDLLADGSLDAELKEMAQIQLEDAKEQLEEQMQELKILLLPKDPNDDKNVIIAIRGGAGGFPVRKFTLPYVQHVCRISSLEAGDPQRQSHRTWRLQGNQLFHRRRGCIFTHEIRKRRASCTACSGNRITGTYSHLNGNGCGTPRSR